MGDAAYAVPHFLGGEISKFAQGRFDKPDYRNSLNVCLNAFPVEMGAWTRRPGMRYASTTRGGAAGRVIKFDFNQAAPYTVEFTNGYARFRSGASLVTTNDAQVVSSISTANPAVVTTVLAHGWSSGNRVFFANLGSSMPLLQNREFVVTVTGSQALSLTDGITGATIDGSTLGVLPTGAAVQRVHEISTIFTDGSWANIRPVQAETTDILLSPKATQALTVRTLPSGGGDAQFDINPAVFLDGPYLDPVAGSTITPSATSGIIDLSLSFQAYSATVAYSKNAYVLSSGIGYKSLQDANLNHTPASSPTFWQAVSPGDAVNKGNGFVSTDIGRLVRLYNNTAPAAWSNATTYNEGDLVSSASVNYRSLVSGNLNKTPASEPLFWAVYSPGWTWGRITALSTTGLISPSGVPNIGTMTTQGGLAAAFDGTISKTRALSAVAFDALPPLYANALNYVGKNFTGAPKAISSAIITPTSDLAFASPYTNSFINFITLNLRAKATAPANSSDGTLLATTGAIANQTTPVTLTSNDSTTTWNYVWIEQITGVGGFDPGLNIGAYSSISQVQFYGSSGIAGTGVKLQLLGPNLPNTGTMTSWRLGVYSDTTGYPTCGTYFEGRLWLGGAVPNRFDASVSNGISGGTLNFAPTDSSGAVAASNAISYVLNSDSVNPIFWFQPDLQGIIIGTQAGEWLVQAPTAGGIAPNNIAARRVTKNGCANIEPRRTENTNVFVQRYGQKLMEYFADVYSGKFSAPNLADKAQHITRVDIAELAYQQAVTPIIWGRGGDGSLFGLTYKRDTLTTAQGPTFAAWHRHTLGSGRVVESVCAGPSVGGTLDTLTMVTNDPATGIRHVELLTDTPDEAVEIGDVWLLDDAVVPTSTLSDPTPIAGAPYGGLYLYGLWHLNGKTVQVFAGGLDCGDRGDNSETFTDFVVTNGAVFVPYGDSVSSGSGRGLFTAAFAASGIQIVVGFTYTSDGQLVRPIMPADTGARNGPALGKTRRNQRYAALWEGSKGVSMGTSFDKLRPANFRAANGDPIGTLETFSGVVEDTIEDDYSFDGMICWRATRPMPANLVAIEGFIQTQDK